jgi:hypothetical protein
MRLPYYGRDDYTVRLGEVLARRFGPGNGRTVASYAPGFASWRPAGPASSTCAARG